MEALNQKIRTEQVRMIYQQGAVMVSAAFLFALVMAFFLWGHLPGNQILLWLAFIVTSTGIRSIVFWFYFHFGKTEPAKGPWALLYCVTSFIAGVAWGVLPVMFYGSLPPEYLLLISTMFAGMVAITAAAGSVYIPSFYNFVLPLVLPLIVLHVQSRIDYLVMTGGMMTLFLMTNILLARRGRRYFIELVEARFRNADLMDKISAEKAIAEQAVVEKGQFLAAASHDLRQPLHALGLFISSLRKRDDDSERLSIIDDIESSTQSLGQLLHSLLDMSKLDAGVIEVESRRFYFSELTGPIVKSFASQADLKDLTFTVDNSQYVFDTDPMLLDRVVRNLVSNAIRYTAQGGVSVSVETVDEHSYALVIEDSGMGIPEAQQELVFQEYHQLDNPDQSDRQGRGLGLAIVKRLCDLLSLSLSLDSVPGHGTRFTIVVPRGDADLIRGPAESAVSPSLGQRTVLLIDDEQPVLDAMTTLLEDNGCVVLPAQSGAAAIYQVAVAGQLPDIIVSDFRLREGETGLDVVSAVREGMNSDIPAVKVTGETSPARLQEVASSDLVILHKPVQETRLIDTMARCLSLEATGPETTGATHKRPASVWSGLESGLSRSQ